MSIRTRSLIFSLLLCLSAVPAFADDPPAWLVEASKQTVPTYDIKNVPAVVLRSEENLTVSSDGTVLRTTRYAVRVLVREGREEAVARVVYQTDSEKVRDLNAWLIPRSGAVRDFGKKETIDAVLADNDLYNEARVRVIDASEIADTGDVFGYETVTEERTIFSQFQFRFQYDLPVLFSRFSLTLPTGWRADSVTFNHPAVQPAVNGSSYAWELRSLGPINYEAQSPSRSSLTPRLAVSFYPTAATATQIRTFSNWSDVARWMAEIEEPQMTVDDALAAKAQDLTVNAKTEFEKIQAISRYVQNIQYISIQVGTGRGGGYRPHSATEVFAKSYGDCKDKANLMRAMLSVLKIPAYLVSVTADDRDFVRAEWASPHQFNHCIIAVKISDATKAASVVIHPKLGRLLIFDATDPYTPLGDLPEEQQGSYALIDHRDVDSLTRLPDMPSDMNRLDRSVDISLSTLGDITGTVNERSVGQSAVAERSRLRRLSAPEYNRMIEGWISRGATGAKAVKISPVDNHTEGNFNLDVEFNAKAYAQIMQGRLMVFKPAVIGRLERLSFTEGRRSHPFVLDNTSYSESVKIKLPVGFEVDEMPEPAKLETAFGKYSADYKVVGDSLVFTRSLVLNRSTIPADKYDSVKNFFGSVHAAEQSPVVLIKK
jgi:hypothetical protein